MEVGSGHIELAGVVKTFDGFVNAVDGVNLKIPDGAYCCLLGPSGCGKTTILRMIAGHDDPTAGEILIGGENVVGLPPVGAPHRHDVPVLRAVSASYRARQHRLCAAGARHRQGRAPQGRRRHDGEGQADGIRRPAARATFRRPAAARRARPRRHHRAARAAARRAALRARRVPAHPDAPGAAPHAARARHHLRSRHPHPARGDRARRSRGGDGEGQNPPGRPGPRRL